VPTVPSSQENPQSVALAPVSSPWLTPSSTVQRSTAAGVVLTGFVPRVQLTDVPEVIWAAGAGKSVMRGPRPPLGFTTSVFCVIVWGPDRSRQDSWMVTRRKSSGLISAGAPAIAAAAGVQAFDGGVAARPSFGSSNVQTLALTV
jgi:hypothetical protein